MKTEITKDRLSEYFLPTKNFRRTVLDNALVDYAEIEIDPAGIKKLEDNLTRCTERPDEDTDWWKELTNPKSDQYEHIVAYVHFNAGTETFNKLFLEVHTAYSRDDELEVDKLINDEEKRYLIKVALESLRKWRKTDKMLEA